LKEANTSLPLASPNVVKDPVVTVATSGKPQSSLTLRNGPANDTLANLAGMTLRALLFPAGSAMSMVTCSGRMQQ